MARGARTLICTQVVAPPPPPKKKDRSGPYVDSLGREIYQATSPREDVPACVETKFWAPHAIDATLSPWPRRLDGVEAHEGPRIT